MAKLSSSRQKALFRKYSRNVKFLMMLVSICIIVFTLPKQAKFSYDIEKGRIWNQKDLVSPYNFAILKTQQEIESDQKIALASITPIYQADESMPQHQIEGFNSDFEVKWHSAGIAENKKAKYALTGFTLLKTIYDKGVLTLNPKYQQNAENYQVTILNQNVATDKNTADLFTKRSALNYCDQFLNSHKDLDKAFLLDLINNRLQPNLIYDNKLTSRLEKEVVENLSTTRGMVRL